MYFDPDNEQLQRVERMFGHAMAAHRQQRLIVALVFRGLLMTALVLLTISISPAGEAISTSVLGNPRFVMLLAVLVLCFAWYSVERAAARFEGSMEEASGRLASVTRPEEEDQLIRRRYFARLVRINFAEISVWLVACTIVYALEFLMS